MEERWAGAAGVLERPIVRRAGLDLSGGEEVVGGKGRERDRGDSSATSPEVEGGGGSAMSGGYSVESAAAASAGAQQRVRSRVPLVPYEDSQPSSATPVTAAEVKRDSSHAETTPPRAGRIEGGRGEAQGPVGGHVKVIGSMGVGTSEDGTGSPEIFTRRAKTGTSSTMTGVAGRGIFSSDADLEHAESAAGLERGAKSGMGTRGATTFEAVRPLVISDFDEEDADTTRGGESALVQGTSGPGSPSPAPNRPLQVIERNRERITDDREEPRQGQAPRFATVEPTYKFAEVVRNREERKKMHGVDCPCCRKFYAATSGLLDPANFPDAKRIPGGPPRLAATAAERQNRMSRHRHVHKPPGTPPGFWDVGFPDTPAEEFDDSGEAS
ncbi:hypothetical protein HDU93_003369 [Gonapodya sp. JEL0774]|nr:hypothetical protein HDU93_003369 [Gonapodya sp. JEL0774]